MLQKAFFGKISRSQWVNENLNYIYRRDLFAKVRNIKKNNNWYSAWTMDGTIFIKKSQTEGLWLGSWKSRLGKDEPFGISWPKQYVTALGIAFPYNVHVGNKINFDERFAINLKMS